MGEMGSQKLKNETGHSNSNTNQEQIKTQKERPETLLHPGSENGQRSVIGLGEASLGCATKAQTTEAKINKWDDVK